MKIFRVVGLLILMVLFFSSVVTYAQNLADESYDKGIEYATQGKFKEAKEEFEKALKADQFYTSAEQNLKVTKDVIEQKIKRETAVYLFKGTSYYNKDQYGQAISDYTKAIEINPRYAVAYSNRGRAYDKKGQYDQAIKDFTKAIEVNPRFAGAYYNRGLAYKHKNQYDQAIIDYTKAIKVNPRFARAYSNRGVVYFLKLGDKNRGCTDFKQACELGNCKNYNITKRNGDCK